MTARDAPVTEPAATPPLRFSRALALGLTQASSLAPATLTLGAARCLDGLSSVVISAALLGGAFASRTALLAAVGLALATGLAAALLRAVTLGGGLVQGAARMRGAAPVPLAQGLGEASRRSFVYAVVSAAVDATARAWVWLALGTSGTLFLLALIRKSGGIPSAAALALTLTVSGPLLLATAVLTEVALARSIARAQPYTQALFDAVGALWRRPFLALSLFLLYALLGGGLQLTIAALVNGLTAPSHPLEPPVWSLLLAGQATLAVLTGLLLGYFDHARAQSLLAAELHDAALLPPPPRPVPVAPIIPVAQLVPVAPVLPPPAQGG